MWRKDFREVWQDFTKHFNKLGGGMAYPIVATVFSFVALAVHRITSDDTSTIIGLVLIWGLAVCSLVFETGRLILKKLNDT